MSNTAARDETYPDLATHGDLTSGKDNTHDLIRSMVAAESEPAKEDEPRPEPLETEDLQGQDKSEDLDLIRSMVAEEETVEVEETDSVSQVDEEPGLLSPDDTEMSSTGSMSPDDRDMRAPDGDVSSSFPAFLKRPVSVEIPDEDSSEGAPEGKAEIESERQEKTSWITRRRQRAEAKAAQKAARVAEKQEKAEAKAEAKAAKLAAKQAKVDATAEAKAARAAERQARVDAKAEAKAAKLAAKQARIDAAADAKAAGAAEAQARTDAKTAAKATKIAEKQARAVAAAEAKAARAALKQAKADAKTEAKAARIAAKQGQKTSAADIQSAEIQENVLEAISTEDTSASKTAEFKPDEFAASDPAPASDRSAKTIRQPRKPLRHRAAEFRSAVAGIYMRLPDRPTRQQSLRATAVFVLLVQPWLVPLVSLIALVSLTFAYFAMGPDRAAEITGAGHRWLEKRDPEKAEKVRAAAQRISERMSGWISRLPNRWSRGIHLPDFSKDNGQNDKLIEDRFNRLAQEARSN